MEQRKSNSFHLILAGMKIKIIIADDHPHFKVSHLFIRYFHENARYADSFIKDYRAVLLETNLIVVFCS